MLHRAIAATLAVVSGLGLAACEGLRDAHMVDPLIMEDGYTESDGTPPAIQLETYCFPEDGPPDQCASENVTTWALAASEAPTKTAPASTTPPATPAEVPPLPSAYSRTAAHAVLALSPGAIQADKDQARYLRNRLQSQLMERSNRICAAHENAIVADAAGMNFGLGTTTTLLSGAAAVVSGGLAQSILAGSASAANATRSLISEQFYRQQVTETIVRAIEDLRAEKRAEIEVRSADDVATYTLDDAIRDVQDYHVRCSFFSGIVKIGKAIENEKPTAAEVQKQIKALEAVGGASGSAQAGAEQQIKALSNTQMIE